MKFWERYVCLLVFAPLSCAVASVTTIYEPAPFSNYQPILDRMPFGAPPPDVAVPDIDPELLKTAEQEKAEQQQIAKQLSFSALNITPKGTTAVGFTDRTVNPPRSFYLEVGTSADGWTVLAADYNKDWARFEKDGVVITMHLDKGLIEDTSSTNSVSAVATAGNAAASNDAEPPPQATVPASRGTDRSYRGTSRMPGASRTSVNIPGLTRSPSPSSRALPSAEPNNDGEQPAPVSFLERRRERVAQEKEKEEAAKTAIDQANLEKAQKLARKIVEDEQAKRDQEQADTFDRLRADQELFLAQQREAEEREAAEAEADAEVQPEADPEEQE